MGLKKYTVIFTHEKDSENVIPFIIECDPSDIFIRIADLLLTEFRHYNWHFGLNS